MTYQPFLLTEELHITQIITIHYFEYTNTYHFLGVLMRRQGGSYCYCRRKKTDLTTGTDHLS